MEAPRLADARADGGSVTDMLPGLAADPDDVIREARELHKPVRSFCLFSGGHDSTVLAHRCREHYDELAFIDTGTALPGVREFVEEFAAETIGKPLRILEAGDAYRVLVVGGEWRGKLWEPQGFPGPAAHNVAYQRLKKYQVEALVRDAKAEFAPGDRRARVMLLTGTRRGESARRARTQTAPYRRDGGQLWVNPPIDWPNERMRAYRLEHALPESDVAALMHRSGECNCGAFATPGERGELRSLFGRWFEENIAPLERRAEELGLPCARWGDRPREVAAPAGPMCSDCQLRIDDLEQIPGQTNIVDTLGLNA